MLQSRLEEKKNGKDGLKISSIKRTKQQRSPTLESHTPQLLSNLVTHQLRLEERKNGKDGLKISSIKRTKQQRSLTPEFHTHPPSSK